MDVNPGVPCRKISLVNLYSDLSTRSRERHRVLQKPLWSTLSTTLFLPTVLTNKIYETTPGVTLNLRAKPGDNNTLKRL
jgi:hypothetical protein